MKLITEFKEFLTDSLLLEAKIQFSNDFRNLLLDINDDISYDLLNKIEFKEIKTQVNYIEPNLENPVNIKFYPDNKVKLNYKVNGGSQYNGSTAIKLMKLVPDDLEDKPKILKYVEGYTISLYNSDVQLLYRISSKDISREFDTTFLSDICLVKKIDEEKYSLIQDTHLIVNIDKSSIKPSEIRIGRAIKQLLKGGGIDKTDADIEKFVNKWKSRIKYETDKFNYFKLVKGDDIKIWYHQNKYKKSGGTLNGSCMRYDTCQKYFDIYTNNPNVCQMLILTDDNNELVGRALIWKLRNGETFMDRIYYINDSDVNLFKKYAEKEGWYYKNKQNHEPNELIISPEGKNDIKELFVDLDTDAKYYPYMDTLRYINKTDGCLTNDYSEPYDMELDDTEGSYRCPECNGDGNIRCYNCDGDRRIDCDECDGGRIDCDNCTSGRVDCDECNGSGNIIDGDEEIECSNCDGHGWVDCDECDGDGDIRCGSCSGRGNHTCPDCDGEGRIDCPSCG